MAGQSAIWQVQSGAADGTEATATSTNTVLFNETPINSAGGLILSTEFSVRNSIAENARVDGDGNEVQDMGIDGVDVRLTGKIKDADSAAGIDKIMTWIKEEKTTTGFTRGRFGLRLDDFPQFNMVPTATYGMVIQNITFTRDPNLSDVVQFLLEIRVGGDVSGWLAANGF